MLVRNFVETEYPRKRIGIMFRKIKSKAFGSLMIDEYFSYGT